MDLIRMRNVKKTYKTGVTAIHNLDLKIKKGEFVSIIKWNNKINWLLRAHICICSNNIQIICPGLEWFCVTSIHFNSMPLINFCNKLFEFVCVESIIFRNTWINHSEWLHFQKTVNFDIEKWFVHCWIIIWRKELRNGLFMEYWC